MKIFNAARWPIAIFAFLIGLAACKKESDLILSPDQLQVGSYLKLESEINLKLNPATTAPVSIMVSSVGEAVEKITIYLSPSNSTNKATWKKVKEVPMGTDQKATLSVTADEIRTALGGPIPNGATVRLFNEITTKTGKIYNINNVNTDTEGSPDLKLSFRWDATTPCEFDRSVFTGEFTVVTDTWNDYSPGAKVMVEPGPGANQVTIYAYPSSDYGFDRRGVVIDVNSGVQPNTINIPEQRVGTYNDTPPAVTTMKSSTGTLNSCTKTIDIMGITFNYGGTNLSGYRLTLRKI
jgi:hypothetical protein